ncbi:MAG: RHS repeat domain-containing protein, partial [Blastocatellia bacterium]
MQYTSRDIINRAGSRPRSFAATALLLFFCFSLANTGAVFAQNIKYTKGNTDSALRSNLVVDPSTLGMSIQVPLATYPGRGGELPVTLRYASKQWRISFMDTFQTASTRTRTEGKWAEDSVAGWTTSLDLPKVIVPPSNYRGPYDGVGGTICTAPSCNPPPPPTEPILYINRLLLQMPDGSSHELRKDDSTTFNSGPDAGVYYAVDGSNVRYDTATNTILLPDGSRYLLSVSGGTQAQYIDRNGNTMTYTFSTKEWTDTLGRNIKFPLSNQYWGDVTNLLPGVNETTLGYTLKWRYLSECLSSGSVRVIAEHDYIYSNNPQAHTGPSLFIKHLITDYVVSDGAPFYTTYFNPIVLKEIVLPNNKSYAFSYNIYGEIDKVTYPTVGYERFAYGMVPGLDGSLDTSAYAQANRGVTDRWVSVTGDGSDEAQQHWTYSVDTTGPYLVRVIAPNSVKTERLLHRTSVNQQFGFDDARTGRAYEERVISATGQMLRRILTNWVTSGPTPAPPAGYVNATRNARATKTVEILLDTGGNALAKTTTMNYDADLNVIEAKHYDYASVAPSTAQTGTIDSMPLGAHIKTDKALFLLSDPSYSGSWAAYSARNLVALPTATWVETPGGVITARAEFVYDEGGPYEPLPNSPAAAQWSDPGTTARGTATTVRRWLNIYTDPNTGATTTYTWPSGQWLITHTQTDVCGNVRKMWDARGKMSEIKYDGNFSDGNDHDAYAYPTQTLTPPPYTGGVGGLGIPFGANQQLTASMVYDFSTGKIVSATDANGQTTTNSYANDPLQRLTKVTRPTGGGETIYEYNDDPGTTCACDVSVKTRTLQSAGVYVEDYIFFDGAGRPWRTGHREGSSLWSLTDTQYDGLGRVWEVSNPALITVPSGAPTRSAFGLLGSVVTTTTYDALNRVSTVTTPDGSVITTSYNGAQVTVADQANGTPNEITGGQPRNTTRRSVTDALGRLTQVVEAPGSSSYTTNYFYDTLDNLRQVDQGSQNRYFLYDSVGRLVRARNLEQDVNAAYNLTDPVTGSGNNQWTLKYAYDENGNLKKRWDARGVAASFNYDNINRNYS